MNTELKENEALRWFADELLPRFGGNMTAACNEVQISAKTMKALMAGTYQGRVDAMLGKLAEARAAITPRMLLERRDLDHIETGLMKLVFAVCDASKSSHLLNYISGPSQIGKTTSLESYAKAYPETTVLLRMPTRPTVTSMLRELLEVCGLPAARTADKAMRTLRRFLTRRHLLIVDEAHLALTRKEGIDCLDMLRELFDRCGCGMVLSVTDIGARDIVRGVHSERLLQLEKRGEWTDLPKAPKNVDLRAIWQAYGLPEPTQEVLAELGQMARAACLGQYCHRLKLAMLEADRQGVELTWELFLGVARRMGRRPL